MNHTWKSNYRIVMGVIIFKEIRANLREDNRYLNGEISNKNLFFQNYEPYLTYLSEKNTNSGLPRLEEKNGTPNHKRASFNLIQKDFLMLCSHAKLKNEQNINIMNNQHPKRSDCSVLYTFSHLKRQGDC